MYLITGIYLGAAIAGVMLALLLPITMVMVIASLLILAILYLGWELKNSRGSGAIGGLLIIEIPMIIGLVSIVLTEIIIR